jgi:arsenate reductase
LKDIPTKDELKSILKKLGIPAEALIRKSEQQYKDEFKGKQFSETEWIQIMVENPKLIERPIVVKGDRAVLGRPPENVKELI